MPQVFGKSNAGDLFCERNRAAGKAEYALIPGKFTAVLPVPGWTAVLLSVV
jgi:hypothetical protein